jgi:hypothetical protein
LIKPDKAVRSRWSGKTPAPRSTLSRRSKQSGLQFSVLVGRNQ